MKKFILAGLAFAPAFVFAQQLSNLETLLSSIKRLVGLALPIVVALALLGFFWGLMKFIFAKGDEDARKEARQTMIYGIIALFVMVSVWGLVNFIGSALGTGAGSGNNPNQLPVPKVEGIQ